MMIKGTHQIKHAGKTPIYAAGDARNGSTWLSIRFPMVLLAQKKSLMIY